jgi:sugar O-acyltransferase (sialic acid O-acetyltransferase NeuD family)
MKSKRNLLIIGAGGHGKVILDAAIKLNEYTILGFLDDQKSLGTVIEQDFTVLGGVEGIKDLFSADTCFVVAIGDNMSRKRIYDKLKKVMVPAVLVHPSASVSDSAVVGPGSVVLAGAVINSGSMIGENCIVNSLALVDHETRVGSHSHISQGALIGSNLKLPDLFTARFGERVPSVAHP